jgi:serine kinase of HPr protein (carbohydrate metabolism regulator)
MSAQALRETLHGSCVLLGEEGLLIRGRSGAGKSMLARALVARWHAAGRFAAHIADDRVRLELVSGRIVAMPHPAIAGTLEIRGLGLVAVAHERACVLGAVVELVDEPPERLPEPAALQQAVMGISLPSLPVNSDQWLLDRVETFWFQRYYKQDGAMSRVTRLNFSSRCTR